MAIRDIFSRRQRRQRGELPDVYSYDEIPVKLRGQVLHIFKDVVGTRRSQYSDKPRKVYEMIHNELAREYGVFMLANEQTKESALIEFFTSETDPEHVLDVIEVAFQVVPEFLRDFRKLPVPKP